MATCCAIRRINFVNKTTSDVTIQSTSRPQVFVWYLDNESGNYYQSIMTQITITDENIHIDHGGYSTGKILIYE